MSEKSTVLRAPGFLEKYYICRDTTGIMGRGFNISVKLNASVPDPVLSHALRVVIKSCPFLTVNAFRSAEDVQHVKNSNQISSFSGLSPNSEQGDIVAEDAIANGDNYLIRPVKKILFSDVVIHKKVSRLDQKVLEDLSSVRLAVNCETPTWYMARIETESCDEQYLTFACNHVMFDGRSAVHFFDDLVKAIDGASRSKPLETIETLFDAEVDGPEHLQGASEDVTELYDSPAWYKLSALASLVLVPKLVLKFVSSYITRSSPNFFEHPSFELVPFNGVNEAKFRLVHFSPAQVDSILGSCKSQQMTLTPLMAANLYLAIGSAFTPHVGEFSQSCELIIDGRRFYPEKKEATRYGLFFSAFVSFLGPGLTTEEAGSAFKKGLSQAMESRYTFRKTGLLRIINIWGYLKSFTGNKEERQTFEISNLGSVAFSAGEWHLTDVVFSQGVTFSHITLSVISTLEGGMNVAISFHKDLANMSKDGILVVDRCIAQFEENMLRA